MYIQDKFAETDIAKLHELVVARPLASLVTLSSDGLNANHIPLYLDKSAGEFGVLRGHVARANPLWHDYAEDREALAIFQAADSYIRPSWYATKQQTGKVVPTWNYAVVHAYGPLRIYDDVDWLRTHLEVLTHTHEQGLPEPWQISDAPDDFIEKVLKAIVGVELPISRLMGKYKLSQNRPYQDQASAIAALQTKGDDQSMHMANLMENIGK